MAILNSFSMIGLGLLLFALPTAMTFLFVGLRRLGEEHKDNMSAKKPIYIFTKFQLAELFGFWH